jgi:hypothetical protein
MTTITARMAAPAAISCFRTASRLLRVTPSVDAAPARSSAVMIRRVASSPSEKMMSEASSF